MKVLIADDDSVCRMVLKRMLARVPAVEVIEAEDGQAALDAICCCNVPDLCIVDVMMPRLTGLDFLEKVREDRRLKNLRVVLCTTASDRENVTRAAKARVDAYLTKPYDADLLIRELQKTSQIIAQRGGNEDPQAVCARLGVDREALTSMQAEFFPHLNSTLVRLEESTALEDFPTIALISNGIKGACATLGLTRLADTFGQFETAAREKQDKDGLSCLLQRLREQGKIDQQSSVAAI